MVADLAFLALLAVIVPVSVVFRITGCIVDTIQRASQKGSAFDSLLSGIGEDTKITITRFIFGKTRPL